MVEVTLEQFEKNFDKYMDAIENEDAEFLIRKSDGTAVVAVPATDDLSGLYSNHEEAS